MEAAVYKELAVLEEKHWWFMGRRKLAESLLAPLGLSPSSSILEIGCGCGGNLSLLSRFGKVVACEMNADARAVAAGRGIATVEDGTLPDHVPYGNIAFDLIALFDVLEHVEDDAGSLKTIYNRLKPGGYALFTVPAYQWLWSRHDVASHHKRRYTRSDLIARLKRAGFTIERSSYFQMLLFPILLIGFTREWLTGASKQPVGESTPQSREGTINNALYHLLAGERFAMRFFPLPFGPSIILLARKH